MSVHLFGIRHHGPGSARSLRRALTELAPDIVLVEGPPDAQPVLHLVGHPATKPPIALLIYARAPSVIARAPSVILRERSDRTPPLPERRPSLPAVFYPFATFSPEWQALTYAFERGIPARFVDLPQAQRLAMPEEGNSEDATAVAAELRDDPLGWWEPQIEQRPDTFGVFEGILEAMTALRAHRPPVRGTEARREAYMRKSIRRAQKEGFAKIAVVCGAWHAPALVSWADRGIATSDDALLKGLPRAIVEATFIPWTYSRLSYRSGYGAGIASPGWYAHLWESPDEAPLRWVSRVARLLREAGIDASSADVIDTVRLADALAALRGLSMPALTELSDAVQSVLCHGHAGPMALIRQKLEIGEALGSVPEEAPAVPLARDLTATQKRLRLPPRAEEKPLLLDLRSEMDRERSQLLHRLNLLGLHWGKPEASVQMRNEALTPALPHRGGTFHERWLLQWHPEFWVSLVETSVFGNTLESAATAKVIADAEAANVDAPRGLTALLEAAIVSDLPDAIDRILACIQERTALSSDVRGLMDALLPLARATRYGSVRETRAEHLSAIVDGLFQRIAVGLVTACISLGDAAAAAMLQSLGRAHESVALLHRDSLHEEWTGVLRAMVAGKSVHGLLRGAACRLLIEQGSMDSAELGQLARLSLSPNEIPAAAAAWADGLLRGSALLLLQHDALWYTLDRWIGSLGDEAFLDVLPLVRRAFANFSTAERRHMGERVKRLGLRHPEEAGGAAEKDLDPVRAARVNPVLSQILGIEMP